MTQMTNARAKAHTATAVYGTVTTFNRKRTVKIGAATFTVRLRVAGNCFLSCEFRIVL